MPVKRQRKDDKGVRKYKTVLPFVKWLIERHKKNGD